MTIFKVGDKVRRREEGRDVVYEVEDVQGDQYRLKRGDGDATKTLFLRGFELEPASAESKPEEFAETRSPDETRAELEHVERILGGAEAPAFNQIPPPSDLERQDAEDNPQSHGSTRGTDDE